MSVKSLQAPSLGINQHDSWDDMDEGYALVLDNWIAEPGRCRLRRGCVQLSNHTDPIETIMSYAGKCIIAAGAKVIDADLTYTGSVPSVGTATDLGTGFTSAKWQWVGINSKLIMVNGNDAPQEYDGSTLSAITFTSGITNPEECIGVKVFKGRAFYWKDEPGFYYAAAGSYAGALSYFDLSPFVSKIANLKLIFTWSVDVGDGADDFAVFVMDTGEALVYQGSDPSSAGDWGLVGVFSMGDPLSVRGAAGIAGDQVVLTRLGWQNFGFIWNTGNVNSRGIGKNISGLAADAVEEYGGNDGWECHFYPEYRLLMVQVPLGSGNSVQHVMNTNTGGWSTFSGWNATTFGNFNGQIMFGTQSGDLYVAMLGYDDNGEPIYGDCVPAFSYLGSRARNKRLAGIRILSTVDSEGSIEVVGADDFAIPNKPVLSYTVPSAAGAEWGDPWGSPWAVRGSTRAEGEWRNIFGYGYALSYRMVAATATSDLFWYSTQVMFEPAGEV